MPPDSKIIYPSIAPLDTAFKATKGVRPELTAFNLGKAVMGWVTEEKSYDCAFNLNVAEIAKTAPTNHRVHNSK